MKSFVTATAALSLFATAAQATICTIPTSGTDDTARIQSAFESCATGGTVVFTKGANYYLNGMMTLSGLQGTIVQFDGTLNLPAFSSSYENENAYITVSGNSVHWSGSGTINGNGQAWYDAKQTNAPRVLSTKTSNSYFGGLKIIQAPRAHKSINGANNTIYDGLSFNTVSTSSNVAKNADAFDVSSSSGIIIKNTKVVNGDDCLAVNSGVTNLTMTNVYCSGSHGFSIGSLGAGGATATVSDVTITDCSCTNCQNGVRIKTWPGGKGTVSGIKYDNIRLDSVQNPIIITTHYCDNENLSECSADNAESLTISGVTINNIMDRSTATHTQFLVSTAQAVPIAPILL